LEELKYESPGFPVYKTLTVPILVNGKPENVVEATKELVEKDWKETLQGLRNHISGYNRVIENLKNKPDIHEYYEALADIIALYFRQPLQLDPVPSLMVSPLRVYGEVRKTKHVVEVYREDPLETLNLLSEVLKKLAGGMLDEPKPDVLKRLVDCWLKLPADTRPGHNTSGLIPHLLITSAIAWALAVEDNLGREEAAKARLAALLHDMSKPFNYRRHWEITDKVVKLVFDKDVLGSYFVNELSQLVKKHHIRSGDRLGNIIHRADVIASAADRLRSLAEKILKKDLGDSFKVLYGAGEEAWEEWYRLEAENGGKIRELSLRFVKEVAKETQRSGGEVVGDGRLLYFLVDVGGIQEFIYRTVKLRTVAASSYLVDFLVSAYLPLAIQHNLEERKNVWMPVEAFMINGGGNLSFIAPASLKGDIIDILEKIKGELTEKLGLNLYFGHTLLTDSFIGTAEKAAAEVNLHKIKHEKPAKVNQVSTRLCNYCYINPTESKEENLCNSCSKLDEIGDEFRFRNKWGAELVLYPDEIRVGGFEEPYDPEIDLMYVIAGHGPNELDVVKKGRKRKRNVAVVKFDANMMGKFFAESISLTDALERSWRVDMSMKKAYQQVLCELYKAVRNLGGDKQALLAVRQCYLGTLYMGGDDGLIICPSWASIPLAIGISRYFNENMGGVLTLSVGLVATTPEHDIWSSIEAASALLDEAKKVGREITAPHNGFGALCFDVIEGGTLSKSAVKSRHKELINEGLTVQPFTLGGDAGWEKLDTILEYILGAQVSDLGMLFGICWQASRDEDSEDGVNDLQELLKRIRSALREPPEIVRTSKELAIKLSFTYLNRQISRLGDRQDSSIKAYRLIVNVVREYLLKGGGELRTPFADIDRLIKIVGGGVI